MKKVGFRQDIGFPLINVTLFTKLNFLKSKKLLIRWCILRFVSRTNGELLTNSDSHFSLQIINTGVCPLHKHDGSLHYSSVLEPLKFFSLLMAFVFICNRFPLTLHFCFKGGWEALKIWGKVISEQLWDGGGNVNVNPFYPSKPALMKNHRQRGGCSSAGRSG